MRQICIHFAIAYVLAVVGLIVLGLVLQSLAGFEIGSVGTVLPVLVAALYAGHRYGQQTGAPAPSGFAWRAALWMALIGFGLSVLGTGIATLFVPGAMGLWSSVVAGNGFGILVGAFAFTLVLQFLAARYFFGMGAKQAAKAVQKDVVDRF